MKIRPFEESGCGMECWLDGSEMIQPEMNIIKAIVEAQASQNLIQKDFSELTGIAKSMK